MDEIFDFNKTYAGAIKINETFVPCTLIFIDNNIVFSAVAPSTQGSIRYHPSFDLFGYISTEKGIRNFKAIDCFQSFHSTPSTSFSKQEFISNGLLITHEKNDIERVLFAQANIVFDKLEHIGVFLEVDRQQADEGSFTAKQRFEALTFYSEGIEFIELNNPYTWGFSSVMKTVFSLSIEPFFSFKPSVPSSIDDFSEEMIRLGWFIELLFGVNQSITDLVLFEKAVTDDSTAHNHQYYFIHKEMISKKRSTKRSVIRPVYMIEELRDEITVSYPVWYQFNKHQKLLCRLYFNEINSKEYVVDDRFKNLCAIIQGLEVFIGKRKLEVKVSGEMNSKLRKSFDKTLEEIFVSKNLHKDFIYKLFEIIGDQRDHYQHLNKPLKYDLNDIREELIAVNLLLALIIKYHFLQAIKFPNDKIISLIKRDLVWCAPELGEIQRKIIPIV